MADAALGGSPVADVVSVAPASRAGLVGGRIALIGSLAPRREVGSYLLLRPPVVEELVSRVSETVTLRTGVTVVVFVGAAPGMASRSGTILDAQSFLFALANFLICWEISSL